MGCAHEIMAKSYYVVVAIDTCFELQVSSIRFIAKKLFYFKKKKKKNTKHQFLENVGARVREHAKL